MPSAEYTDISNPDFGNGCFRRRIRLEHSPGRVSAELEDSSHGFSLAIDYSDGVVQQIEAQTYRYPYTTCPGAKLPLMAFKGQAIEADHRDINKAINARKNCTHLYDLSMLALAHAARPYGIRVYDVVLPDETDTATRLSVLLNDTLVLEWQVKDWEITAPIALQGQTLYNGFAGSWSKYCGADAETFEYGLIAQKGYLVSHARRYDHTTTAGKAAIVEEAAVGICHTYTPGVIETAHFTRNSYRDFSDCPEKLLRFV